MSCPNPEHETPPDAACADCYDALQAEHTAMSDRYTRMMTENSELKRRLRDAETAATVPTFAQYGDLRQTVTPGGFEIVDGQAYLQGRPRSRPANEDSLLLTFGSRTTGPRGSILLERPGVEDLHALTGLWLKQGWPGVPRRCGLHYRPDRLHDWQCELPPGHLTAPGADYVWYHEGRAIGWSSEQGKPGPVRWTRAGDLVELVP